MIMTTLKSLAVFVAAALLLLFASCASKPPTNQPMVISQTMPGADATGLGGEIAITSTTTNATVVAIDVGGRQMRLFMPDGQFRSYAVDPAVIKLEHLKPGDRVKVVTAEERAVAIGAADVLPPVGTTAAKIQMPRGTAAVVRNVNTHNYKGKIVAIDDWQDSVTLQFSNGQTKTIKVRDDMNLADVKVGDIVFIRVSEATLILLQKP